MSEQVRATEPASLVWERECAFAALAGRHVCPRYRLPCWVCCTVHILIGTLRSVTEGRFDRFMGHSIFTWADDLNGHFARASESRGLICPHHRASFEPEYLRRHGSSYWYYDSPHRRPTS